MAAIQLRVEAIALDGRGSPVVKLREVNGERAVFIWIGLSEAQAISMQLEGQRPPRPLTHDLIVLIVGRLSAQVERVVIRDMQDNTYYADLYLRNANGPVAVDCRPSDAIAVALRTDAPIYIDNDLLDRLNAARKEGGPEPSSDATVVEPGEPILH